MEKFKVSTRLDSRTENQFFEQREQAEAAAVELSHSGFFSTLWQRGQINPVNDDPWRYICEFAGKEVAA